MKSRRCSVYSCKSSRLSNSSIRFCQFHSSKLLIQQHHTKQNAQEAPSSSSSTTSSAGPPAFLPKCKVYNCRQTYISRGKESGPLVAADCGDNSASFDQDADSRQRHPRSDKHYQRTNTPETRRCFMANCPNTIDNTDKQFFLVPDDVTERYLWMRIAGCKLTHKKMLLHCCADHFAYPEDYQAAEDGRVLLPDALPKESVQAVSSPMTPTAHGDISRGTASGRVSKQHGKWNAYKKNTPETRRCFMAICPNTIDNTDKQFFLVPDDVMERYVWMRIAGCKLSHKNMLLHCCADHFAYPEDYQAAEDGRVLSPDALPRVAVHAVCSPMAPTADGDISRGKASGSQVAVSQRHVNWNAYKTNKPDTRRCFMANCPNTTDNTDKQFFLVPDDLTQRYAWMRIAGCKLFHKKMLLHCCADHFAYPEDYLVAEDGRVLSPDALPRVAVHAVSSPMAPTARSEHTVYNCRQTFISRGKASGPLVAVSKRKAERLAHKTNNSANTPKWRQCFMANCPNTTTNTDKQFFLVPDDVTQRYAWMRNAGCEVYYKKLLYCCSDHFTYPEDYLAGAEGRDLLPDALPRAAVHAVSSPMTIAAAEHTNARNARTHLTSNALVMLAAADVAVDTNQATRQHVTKIAELFTINMNPLADPLSQATSNAMDPHTVYIKAEPPFEADDTLIISPDRDFADYTENVNAIKTEDPIVPPQCSTHFEPDSYDSNVPVPPATVYIKDEPPSEADVDDLHILPNRVVLTQDIKTVRDPFVQPPEDLMRPDDVPSVKSLLDHMQADVVPPVEPLLEHMQADVVPSVEPLLDHMQAHSQHYVGVRPTRLRPVIAALRTQTRLTTHDLYMTLRWVRLRESFIVLSYTFHLCEAADARAIVDRCVPLVARCLQIMFGEDDTMHAMRQCVKPVQCLLTVCEAPFARPRPFGVLLSLTGDGRRVRLLSGALPSPIGRDELLARTRVLQQWNNDSGGLLFVSLAAGALCNAETADALRSAHSVRVDMCDDPAGGQAVLRGLREFGCFAVNVRRCGDGEVDEDEDEGDEDDVLLVACAMYNVERMTDGELTSALFALDWCGDLNAE